jgi:hypothetical protein
MNRFSFSAWALAGFLAGGAGWFLGGFIGTFLPQTILATAATGATVGMLARVPRLALLTALAAGLAAGIFFMVGVRVFTPLLAWPASAMATGTVTAALLHTRRERIATILAAPFFGSLGLLAGMAILVLAGITLDNSRLLGQFMWGGAAGFGLLTAAAVRTSGRRRYAKGGR